MPVLSEGCINLTTEEKQKYENIYREIVGSLVSLNENNLQNMGTVTKWMETVIYGNVERIEFDSLATSTFKSLVPDASCEKLELACVLDWMMEFFHGANKMCENIMDHKTKSTWHSSENVGMMAVNDAIILRACTYNILKIYFENKHPFYNQLEDLRRDVCDQYHLGRGLYETLKKDLSYLETFTEDQYREVVNLRVGFNSYYAPVMLAFNLAEKSIKRELEEEIKTILLDIGYYHEIQQDYTQLFANVDEDQEISEGELKLNWFFVKALEILRKKGEDYWILQEYVESKNVSGLKQLYKEKGLLRDFITEKNALKEKIFEKTFILKQEESVEGFISLLNLLIS